MEINKFFNELPIRILGTHEEPAFYANEVAKLLNITNIRRILQQFPPIEIMQLADRDRLGIKTYRFYKNRTPAQDDNIILLTEFGVYRMIQFSKTDIAELFRNWVYTVLRELRLRGKYEIQQNLEKLKTINEMQLAKIHQLSDYNRQLLEKQKQFKVLTEKLYIIEYENNPRLIKQRHVINEELPDDYESDIDEDSDDDEYTSPKLKNRLRKRQDQEMYNRIDNWDLYCRMFPNEDDRTSKYTYKLTSEYNYNDKIAGTVRWELFVKDKNMSLKLLDEKLSLYRLESIDSVHYYACDLDKILMIANGIKDEIS